MPSATKLQDVVRELRRLGIVPAAGSRLGEGVDAVVDSLLDAVGAEVPAYTESGNPEILPELRAHLTEHGRAVSELLSGRRPAEMQFATAYAQRTAAQKFPLDAILQAYRCMHRVFAVWARDVALEVADSDVAVTKVVAAITNFTIEYTGTVATLVTSDYVRQTRLLAEAEGDRRTALLNTLLDGYDEADQQAARLLRRAGYLQQRQSYCVAVACSVIPDEMESAPRAQRMLDAVMETLASSPLRAVAGVRDNLVTVVMSGTRRRSGWTVPQTSIAERVYPHLRRVGPAALIGVSSDVPSTSHIPRAAQEARIALDHASVASRVVRFSSIPFRRLLVAEARANIQPALPPWLDAFVAIDDRAKGALSETLRTYADCNMNVLRTAEKLALHPNTIYARMQRIDDAIGRSALDYHALTEILLALECRAC